MIRLNKYLAQCGIASRRACDSMIQAGRVQVNGTTIVKLGIVIDPDCDVVTVDGSTVQCIKQLIYVLLNKTKGYVSTANDELKRRTVFDLIDVPERIFSVGRLDKDTEGLLLLTNDGELSYRLTHPRYKVMKKYSVRLHRRVNEGDVRKLRKGIMLDDGITAPCEINYDRRDRSGRTILMTIHEGRNRQIRRMFKTVNYRVVHLKRVQFANLTLKGMAPGQWRFLTDSEIKALKSQVNL